MRKGLLFGLALFALALLIQAPAVQGAVINSYMAPGVINQLQDFDAERLLDSTGAPKPLVAGQKLIQVGDYIEAIVKFDTINSTNIPATLGASYQLTGYSKVQVLALNPTATPGLYNIIMGPGIDRDGDLVNETCIELYENTNVVAATAFDVTVDPDLGGIARATSGNLIATLGFGQAAGVLPPSNDDFWVALNAPQDISVFKTTAAGGTFHFGLTVLLNPGLLPIDTELLGGGVTVLAGLGGTTHDVAGNGSLKMVTYDMHSDWDAQTDTLAVFKVVPEPASVVVWTMLAGIALGLVYRRRSAK
ncbi:MAG: hypothetical protein JW809_01165 [Pirellulales bacterium]|nr:hypothetical protein [Pirellulales bacterium]